MIMTDSLQQVPPSSHSRLMRCKQFNAKLSATIGSASVPLSFSFSVSLFVALARQSPFSGVSGEHWFTRYNRTPEVDCPWRALYGPSVPSRFQTRLADGLAARDFIGKRTESKTILYGTFLAPSLYGPDLPSLGATTVAPVSFGVLSRGRQQAVPLALNLGRYEKEIYMPIF